MNPTEASVAIYATSLAVLIAGVSLRRRLLIVVPGTILGLELIWLAPQSVPGPLPDHPVLGVAMGVIMIAVTATWRSGEPHAPDPRPAPDETDQGGGDGTPQPDRRNWVFRGNDESDQRDGKDGGRTWSRPAAGNDLRRGRASHRTPPRGIASRLRRSRPDDESAPGSGE